MGNTVQDAPQTEDRGGQKVLEHRGLPVVVSTGSLAGHQALPGDFGRCRVAWPGEAELGTEPGRFSGHRLFPRVKWGHI